MILITQRKQIIPSIEVGLIITYQEAVVQEEASVVQEEAVGRVRE